MTGLLQQSLHDVAALLARRELSPVELTEATLARIERLDPTLHSYLAVFPERALAAARHAEAEIAAGRYRGVLHGVPIAIKDLFDWQGTVTSCASPMTAGRLAAQSATVVERLEAAGAVIVGKTNLYEYAFMGYHPGAPQPRNPWNTDCDTGGSSSGSGAAVAAGLCFAALGTDTGGSIRMPSAWCGVVGLKPTRGRVSREGVFPLAGSLDHVGPMARTVRDVAVVLHALGPDPRDLSALRSGAPVPARDLDAGVAGLRIGWDESYAAGGADAAVVAAVRAALQVLEHAGAQIVPVAVPQVDAVLEAWSVICAREALATHAATYPVRADEYGPSIRSFLDWALQFSVDDEARARAVRSSWSGCFAGMFEHIDALACPSSFSTAPPAGALDPHGTFSPEIFPFGRYTFPFNCTGSPTLSVPCGFTADGLPHSLQLVGRDLDEALLCRIGRAYQQATDWHTRRPQLA